MFWPSPPADSYLPAQEHIQLLSWESPPRLSTELCWLHGRVYLLTGAQQNMLLRTERLPSALLGLSRAHSLRWFRLCLSPSLEREHGRWSPGLGQDWLLTLVALSPSSAVIVFTGLLITAQARSGQRHGPALSSAPPLTQLFIYSMEYF